MSNRNPDDPRAELLHRYTIATQRYAEAVAVLDRRRSNIPREEYEDLYRNVESARAECERLRSEIGKVPPEVG